MPPGMPATSVMHIRRHLSPCLLHLSVELLDAGNCPQLVGALLQNRPEVFSGIGLCAVPRSNISHPEKDDLFDSLCTTFLVVHREFPPDMRIICWHLGKLCA